MVLVTATPTNDENNYDFIFADLPTEDFTDRHIPAPQKLKKGETTMLIKGKACTACEVVKPHDHIYCNSCGKKLIEVVIEVDKEKTIAVGKTF